MPIGPQLGIDAESALSLALVRRARELVVGGPGLLAGWWLQRSDLHAMPAAAPAAPEPIGRSAPRARP